MSGETPLTTASEAVLSFGPEEVVKAHRPGTDPTVLARRLALWPADVGLPLLSSDLTAHPPTTHWPRATPMSEANIDWPQAGSILGRLHRKVDQAPHHGWPARLERAVARAKADWLRRLGATLLSEIKARDEPSWLIHGDYHLGQLGHWRGRWWLLDPDDVGAGDPAWDLARIAGFWAAGLLNNEHWHRFLDGYRGTAVTPLARAADPWEHLELPARVAVYVAAVRQDHHSAALLAACAKMANLSNEFDPSLSGRRR